MTLLTPQSFNAEMAARTFFSFALSLPSSGMGFDVHGKKSGASQPAVRIDTERMDKALASPRSVIPNGLSVDEIVDFLDKAAKKRA